MSDVMRAHVRVARSPGPETPSRPPHGRATVGLTIKSLVSAAPVVSGQMKLGELLSLAEVQTTGVIVRRERAEFAVVLPTHVQDFLRDEELQKLLIAEDVARPVPTISEHAQFLELARALSDGERSDAVIVLRDDLEPGGIITPAAAGNALLSWYAAEQNGRALAAGAN